MRGLLITNPTATRVTPRRVGRVREALVASMDLDTAVTKGRGHASHLAAGAAHEGIDVVFAYGGDGTVNEVLQGVAETDVALGLVPGGSTNVLVRTLGLPEGPVEAASAAVAVLREGRGRPISLGNANGRWFAFCAGFGFDAAVARRVERRWRLRPTALLQAAYLLVGAAALVRGFDRRGTDITVTVPGREPLWSMRTVVCCNSDPYTFLRDRPARLCPGAEFDGALTLAGIDDLSVARLLRTVRVALASDRVGEFPWVHSLEDVAGATCVSRDPVPWQVDGDYVGETDRLVLRSAPAAVRVLAPGAGARGGPGA